MLVGSDLTRARPGGETGAVAHRGCGLGVLQAVERASSHLPPPSPPPASRGLGLSPEAELRAVGTFWRVCVGLPVEAAAPDPHREGTVSPPCLEAGSRNGIRAWVIPGGQSLQPRDRAQWTEESVES